MRAVLAGILIGVGLFLVDFNAQLVVAPAALPSVVWQTESSCSSPWGNWQPSAVIHEEDQVYYEYRQFGPCDIRTDVLLATTHGDLIDLRWCATHRREGDGHIWDGQCEDAPSHLIEVVTERRRASER